MAPKKKETFFDFPRPVDATELIGHGAVRRAFLDAWARRDEYPIHPVWLLTGPKGIGKATLAYDLARHIFSEIFGRDVSQQMSVGGIGDLFIVDLEHNLVPAKSITMNTVCDMIEKLQLSSMGESWRVVIIDSIDELSRGTENTLLKTLEEPPAKTIFFVIAHSLDAVLPTIRSRARVEKMRPLPSMDLLAIGAKLLPGKEIGSDLIKISGGSFGRIAGLIATGADTLFADTIRMLKDKTANGAHLMTLAKRIAANPENMAILTDASAYFGLANIYSEAIFDIDRANVLNLDPEIAAFKILTGMKKCL